MPRTSPAPSEGIQTLLRYDMTHKEVALDRHLEGALELLQGAIGPADRIHIIFSLLLFKRLSDAWEERHDKLQIGGPGATSTRGENHVHAPGGCHWSDVCRRTSGLGKALNESLRAIGRQHPHLEDGLGDIDFADSKRFSDALLRDLLSHLSSVRLGHADIADRALGEACERLRERFADDVTKKDGGFITPSTVARLMVELIEPQEHTTIYDPVCGSAGLLLGAVRHIERAGKDVRSLRLFGEERSGSDTRISLLLSGIDNAAVCAGDCLSESRFVGAPTLLGNAGRSSPRFDYVLGNPPFSAPWVPVTRHRGAKGEEFLSDLDAWPSRSMSELAFLLHMLGSLAEGGRMAVIMPHSVLFKRGTAQRIRAWMLRKGYLEAIIGLGPALFVGTDTPVVLLLLRRVQPADRRGAVLMVRGEVEFVRGERRNHLSEAGAARLSAAVRKYGDEPGFSRVVTLEELARNDFECKLSRYIGIGLGGVDDRNLRRPQRQQPASNGETANTAIDAAQRALERARQRFSVRAAELFTRGMNGIGSEHPELGSYPYNWELARLEALVSKPPRNGIVPAKNGAKPKQVRYISQSDLDPDGFVKFDGARTIGVSEDVYAAVELCAGDVLIRRVNGSRCGTAVLVAETPPPAVFASGIIRLRVDPHKLDPLVLLCWLHHTPIRRLIALKISSSVQISINHEALASLWYPRVPANESQPLVAELRRCYEEVVAQARRLAALRSKRGFNDMLASARRGRAMRDSE